MTVNNVNALSSFGTVQGSQASGKPEEVVQERFDKLMNKMSDQLTSLQKAQAGSSVAATASKQAVAESVKSAQETAQPKDALRQDGAAEAQKPGEAAADDAAGTAERDGNGMTTEAKDVQTQDTETQETVEKAAEELVGEIADVMDIPLEKVEEAMEVPIKR